MPSLSYYVEKVKYQQSYQCITTYVLHTNSH